MTILDFLILLIVLYFIIGIIVLIVYKDHQPERFWLVLTWPRYLLSKITSSPPDG